MGAPTAAFGQASHPLPPGLPYSSVPNTHLERCKLLGFSRQFAAQQERTLPEWGVGFTGWPTCLAPPYRLQNTPDLSLLFKLQTPAPAGVFLCLSQCLRFPAASPREKTHPLHHPTPSPSSGQQGVRVLLPQLTSSLTACPPPPVDSPSPSSTDCLPSFTTGRLWFSFIFKQKRILSEHSARSLCESRGPSKISPSFHNKSWLAVSPSHLPSLPNPPAWFQLFLLGESLWGQWPMTH